MIKLVINEGEEGATIEGIPDLIWERFKEKAKIQFPKDGDNAWAAFLSNVVLSVAGGANDVTTMFMTDIPTANVDALEEILNQGNWSWPNFHAYLLRSAVRPGAIRIVNFVGEPQQPGIVIITGLRPSGFMKIEQATQKPVENILAALFNAAENGTISFKGDVPEAVPV